MLQHPESNQDSSADRTYNKSPGSTDAGVYHKIPVADFPFEKALRIINDAPHRW